jgi:prepilin-type N-terminal cleavage/methylation domain-containing protein/prepilin-type processing-associated H-X9-DG protein
MPKNNSAPSAFTLIELLIVITVIAVLAGIAIPVFTGVKRRALATQDANNLRQLGLTMLLYLNENDSILPATSTWPGTTTSPGLYPKYVSTRKIFQSPFDRRPSSESDTAPVSYSVNANMYAANPGVNASMLQVVSASSTIFMAPKYSGDPDNLSAWAGTATSAPNLAVGGNASKGTHGNGGQINALFCDSHIESLVFGPSSRLGSFQDTTSDPLGLKHWDPTK